MKISSGVPELLYIKSNLLILIVSFGWAQKPFDVLAYSPFRDGQNPSWTQSLSEEQIREDMRQLLPLTNSIRTYGLGSGQEIIARIAFEQGMNVHLGAWISQDRASNQIELNNLIQIVENNYSTTLSLIVGNEVLLRNEVSPQELIDYISTVKKSTSLPVTTAAIYQNILNHPNVVNSCDFIMYHVHPYWEEQNVSNANNHILSAYNLVVEKYPGKPLILGETGFPSQGNPFGLSSLPSLENQEIFINRFINMGRDNGIRFVLFTSYDENWKLEGNTGVGPHWGIFYSDRRPKPFLQNITKPVFDWNPDPMSKDYRNANDSSWITSLGNSLHTITVQYNMDREFNILGKVFGNKKNNWNPVLKSIFFHKTQTLTK